jgi:hypothetical protein
MGLFVVHGSDSQIQTRIGTCQGPLATAAAEAIAYLAKYFLLFLAGIRKDYKEM